MDALEMSLLFDYYGGMLTEKQRDCFDMRYNQDLSLGEIGQILGISRQAVCDNLTRTEALLRKMEDHIGCIARDREVRSALECIERAAEKLMVFPDQDVLRLGRQITVAVQSLKE